MASVDIGGVDPGYDGGQPNAYGGGPNSDFGTGNSVIDALLGMVPGLGAARGMAGFLDFLSTQNWGDGVAGRGSSNNPTEQGANGPWDQLIQTLTGNNNNIDGAPPTPRPPVTEGGRAVAGSNGMRRPNMPSYRGIGRSRTPVAIPDGLNYTGGSQNFDERTGMMRPNTGATPNGRSPFKVDFPSAPVDSMSSIMGPGAAAPDMSGVFNNMLESRSGGLNDYMAKMLQRGDIAPDQASIDAEVNPVLDNGRQALRGYARNAATNALTKYRGSNMSADQIMQAIGGDIDANTPQNVLDTDGLGARIGARQGAQNVNVRGRIAAPARRY